MKKTRDFRGPDGTQWAVDVRTPGSTNATVIFRHPDFRTSRLDRYAWYISSAPESRSVKSRLVPADVLESLDESAIALLFRRSFPISPPLASDTALKKTAGVGSGSGV